jgi:hypothetical protein
LVLAIVEERLDDVVDGRRGRPDIDPLAPHVEGLQRDGAVDQRVLQERHARVLGNAGQRVSAELARGLATDARPARILQRELQLGDALLQELHLPDRLALHLGHQGGGLGLVHDCRLDLGAAFGSAVLLGHTGEISTRSLSSTRETYSSSGSAGASKAMTR